MILQLNAPYAPVCMAYALFEDQSSRAFFYFKLSFINLFNSVLSFFRGEFCSIIRGKLFV